MKIFFYLIAQILIFYTVKSDLNELRLLSYSKNHTEAEFKKDILIVHAIPHSHQDVGWLMTFQEYYDVNSNKQNVQQFLNVRQIFDSVFENLIDNPDYTFIISEMAYFDKWWDELLDDTKEDVKNLVKNGQIEFVSGGWVQNDEACSYYEDIIDQMTTGHQFLYEQFKVTPTIGWQMDPFGHSRSQAYLFTQMGINSFFMGRIDVFDEYQRLDRLQMKFMWQIDNQSQIYSEILFNKYVSPKGYDWDVQSQGSTKAVDEGNVDEIASKLAYYLRNVSTHYPGKNIMQLWGNDFTMAIAEYQYQNLTKVFNKINENKDKYKIQIQFSTPSKYIQAVQQENLNLSKQFQGDFIPYRDKKNGFWTGFFSSRVDLKGLIRKTGKYLHTMRNYMLFESLNQQRSFQLDFRQIIESIKQLEKAQSVTQHHDAITGTSTLQVANNYVSILQLGIEKFDSVLCSLLQNRTQYDINEVVNYLSLESNSKAQNQLKIFLQQSKNILISVYNPHNTIVQKILTLNITSMISEYYIINQQNQILKSEYFCLQSLDDCQLYIDVNLKPQQINYFKIIKGTDHSTHPLVQQINTNTSNLNNEQSIRFVSQISEKQSRKFIYKQKKLQNKFKYKFEINYGLYEVAKQDIQEGAYIFRPNNVSEYYTSFPKSGPKIFEGQLVSCMIFQNQELDMILRLQKYQNNIQIETKIRKLNVPSNSSGQNIILQVVNNNIKNQEVFFHDSNGLFIEKRIRNDKKKFIFDIDEEKISNNYYPVTSFIMIQDNQNSNQNMIIYNDRSQGGSSQFDGSLELMIVRSIKSNDHKGMYEKFEDQDSHQLYHYLFFDQNDSQIRKNQLQFDVCPQIFIAVSDIKNFSINNQTKQKINNLVLQEGLKLTLRYWLQEYGEEHFIFRLQNMDTQNIIFYNDWKDITVINQTTLTGNQNISNQIQSQYVIEPLKFITFKIKSNQGLQYINESKNITFNFKSNQDQNQNTHKKLDLLCQFPCQKCYSKQGCLTCQLNLLLTENDECVKKCPQGFLPDYQSFKCVQQQRCKDNYVFQSIGQGVRECMKECFSNYWANNEDRICYPCSQNCEICLHKDKCIKCSNGFFLNESNQCVKIQSKRLKFNQKQNKGKY